MVKKYGCIVAAKDLCCHRVAMEYMLTAGPPTPAAVFMNPLRPPAVKR